MLIEHLKYLTLIEDTGSVHEAARQLHVNPQNLSYIVKTAEKEYGTRIFERSINGMQPTEDGHYILSKIRACLTLYEESHFSFMYPSQHVDTDVTDEIEINLAKMIESKTLAQALDKIQSCFPNITFKLKTMEEDLVWKTVLEKPDTLGIVYSFDNKEMPFREGIETLPLLTFNVALYASKSNVEARYMQSIPLEQAAKLTYVVFAPFGVKNTIVYELLNRFGKPNIKYIIDNSVLMRHLLESGNYYFIAGPSINSDEELIKIPISDAEETSMTMYLLYNKAASETFPIDPIVKIFEHAGEKDL